jgi:site-specific DNA-cytosine methylase
MRYATCVPLIGGIAVAAKQVTGVDPEMFLTYSAFESNELNARNYFPKTAYHRMDVEGMDGMDVEKYKDLDFIQALCPCAGLSRFSSATEEHRMSMNHFMLDSAKFITETLRPKVFWGENAPALFSTSEHTLGYKVRQMLRQQAEKAGYSFSVFYTNTNLHGIPQSRTRTFYFFWRDADVPTFDYYERPRKGLADYLAEVPAGVSGHTQSDLDLARDKILNYPYVAFLRDKYGGSGLEKLREGLLKSERRTTTLMDYLANNFDEDGLRYLEAAQKYFLKIDNDQYYRETVRVLQKVTTKGSFWDSSHPIVRADQDFGTLLSRTVYAVHPTEDRQLTQRECMHLMGLPNDFDLVTTELNHICQNVPVCTAADMTREVVAVLNGERKSTGARFGLQSNFKKQFVSLESKLLGY